LIIRDPFPSTQCLFFTQGFTMRLLIQAPAIALLALALSACDNSTETQSTTAKAASAPKNAAQPVSAETTATPIKNEVTYSASVVPEKMTVQEKKARFRQLLIPAVNAVYAELLAKYEEVAEILADGKPHPEFDALKKEYRAKNNEELLQALKPHPRSIVIAQAAMESAWATSRFFRKANNVFGVWSFDKNEPRIAAGEQRGTKTIWLKKYSTIEASVRDNYRVLARGHKFTGFRKLRMTSEDPY
jgi:Bax protein